MPIRLLVLLDDEKGRVMGARHSFFVRVLLLLFIYLFIFWPLQHLGTRNGTWTGDLGIHGNLPTLDLMVFFPLWWDFCFVGVFWGV